MDIKGSENMRQIINIGSESFFLVENPTGYEIRESKTETIHEVCRFGELNETIYRMIDRICQTVV